MIGVLTTVRSDFQDKMRSVKEAYCRLYGYELVYSKTDYLQGRAFEWRKVGMILEQLPRFDWIVYLAPNVGFANFTIPIERVINEQSKGRGIIVGRDAACSVNTDVVFFRNDATSFEFLRMWLDEQTYVKWNGGIKHDSFAFYKLALDAYAGKVSLVVPCRAFNSLAKCGGDFRKCYRRGDFVENCSMLGAKGVESEAFTILKSNNEYIKGIKKIAKVALNKDLDGEREMINRAEKVCGPRNASAFGVENSCSDMPQRVGSKSPRDEEGVGTSDQHGFQRKIVIETENEKITIFKGFVDKSDMSDEAVRATRSGKWCFSYPSI